MFYDTERFMGNYREVRGGGGGGGGGGEDVNSELLECLLGISPSGRNPCGDNYRAETGSAGLHGETIC